MDLKEKAIQIIEALKKDYPQALCALHSQKDYELMIAVRLSAQCTDERVNMITPALFERFPTLESFATADVAEVETLIHSCGFYKQKARDIVLACQMLLTNYDGKVPDKMEDLLKLPGVGRKTANLLLGDLYAVPGSVVCDTHCIRICGKLGHKRSHKMRNATPVRSAAGGKLRLLPPDRPSRTRRLHSPQARLRAMWPGNVLCLL